MHRNPRQEALSLETRVILAAARPDPPAAGDPLLADIFGQAPDQDRIVCLARRHGLLPTLYRLLHRRAPAQGPWGRLTSLVADMYHASAAGSLRLARETLRLAELLREQKVSHLFFKGPVSAQRYLGDFSLRQSQDIDLLVAGPHRPAARALLAHLGYRPLLPLDARGQEACLDLHGGLALQRPGDGMLLDLHVRLCPRAHHLDFQEERMLGRARETGLGRGRVKTLSHEDQLLYICLHGAKHHWSQMRLVADPALVLARVPDLDWDQVARQARRMRLERLLGLGLGLCSQMLGTSLPAGPARRLAGLGGVAPLVNRVRGFLLDGDQAHPGALGALGLYLRSREGLADRLKCGLHLALLPGPEDLALSPPGGRHRMWSRPWRVLRKHGW